MKIPASLGSVSFFLTFFGSFSFRFPTGCDLINVFFGAVCEHAYSLAQNLDPNSEGRGVLQFKTGLMSVVKVWFPSLLLLLLLV